MEKQPILDIIIPVYRGYAETLRCIESVLNSRNQVKTPNEIIVINDASPDPHLTESLNQLPRSPHLHILHHETNQGFVRTVNHGMSLHSDRNVVLLNSDTEVNGDWLDRLVECAKLDPRIGTITPFSNNATICSYPKFCRSNDLPSGMDIPTIDAVFASLPKEPVEIPTAVGFCMWIRRDCLRQIGFFNAERFGRGYGEENDFCQRAKAKGWKNVLYPRVFVKHVGGVSFAEEQAHHSHLGTQEMRKLHPHYFAEVERHIRQDPLRPLRRRADLHRLRDSGKSKVLFISHALGGGIEKHIQDLAEFAKGHAEILVLRPMKRQSNRMAGPAAVSLEWLNSDEEFQLFFRLDSEFHWLIEILKWVGIDRIHFHHSMTMDPKIRDLPQTLNLPYDFTFHDYHPICPQIHLNDENSQYCGEPDNAGCNACIQKRPIALSTGNPTIESWRERYGAFLKGARQIIAPSHDVARRIQRYYPELSIQPVYHLESAMDSGPSAPIPNGEPLRVLLFGLIDPKKGAHLVLAAAHEIQRRKLPITLHCLGKILPPPPTELDSVLRSTGNFAESEIDSQIQAIQPHLAWFPAQIPETYSYALSAFLRNQIPVAITDLGALPERLRDSRFKHNSRSWVRPWKQSASEWVNDFMDFRRGEIPTSVQVASGRSAPLSPELVSEPFYSELFRGKSLRPHPRQNNGSSVLPPFSLKVLAYPARPDEITLRDKTVQGIRNVVRWMRDTGIFAPLIRKMPANFRSRAKHWLSR